MSSNASLASLRYYKWQLFNLMYTYTHLHKKAASTTLDNVSFGISTKKEKDTDRTWK